MAKTWRRLPAKTRQQLSDERVNNAMWPPPQLFHIPYIDMVMKSFDVRRDSGSAITTV
jgi:hypothetical protein